MRDNKPWYEKMNIWVCIVAGIFAILGISVFDDKALFRDTDTGDRNVTLRDNEIGTGDQSPIVFGNNNIFNYGNTDSGSTSKNDSNEFSVVASYDMNTFQSSPSGIDVLVKAETSFSADHVTISGISDNAELKSTDMHGGRYEWNFRANFYIKGTYIVTVTAYDSEGESVSDEFTFKY